MKAAVPSPFSPLSPLAVSQRQLLEMFPFLGLLVFISVTPTKMLMQLFLDLRHFLLTLRHRR